MWRVPKDRGPTPYLAALVTKALVKHGWPAKWETLTYEPGFQVLHDRTGLDHEPDFAEAVSVAVRIVARTYRVDVLEVHGAVIFQRPYRVGAGGHFVEVKE